MNTVVPAPYETIFSWLSRTHLKYGVGSYKNTYLKIFGKKKVRIHPYLPNHISELGDLGGNTAIEWLYGHTLYPLFHFFEHDSKGTLKDRMLSDHGSVIAAAHIAHSHLCIPLRHKYCPRCIEESVNNTGIRILDIRYQIPGITVCPKHNCCLNVIDCGDGALDNRLLLPRDPSITYPSDFLSSQFSQFCFDLYDEISKNSNPIDLRSCYLNQLSERGLVTPKRRLRLKKILHDLNAFYSPMAWESGTQSLHSFEFIAPVLRDKTHYPSHPLKHLLLAFWLFEGNAQCYFESSTTKPQQPDHSLEDKNINDEIINRLVAGESMEAIKRLTGKSQCFIRRRAELNNIPHESNIQGTPESIKRAVIVQALLGRHRETIANNLDLGVGYVEQVISNTKGLVSWRKQLNTLRAIEKSVKEIRSIRALHPAWRRKEIKSCCSKAFFCLYHHARALLEEVLPKKSEPFHPQINWELEDERLWNAMKGIPDIQSLSISAIGRKINDHGHLRRKLDHLPNTKAWLQKHLKI